MLQGIRPGKRIVARAPVRMLDLGGWTDIRLLPSGRVLNFALRLYTYVTVEHLEDPGSILIESRDIEESEYIRNIRKMEYTGALSLLKAAIRRMGVRVGLKIRVRSEAPPASGLGSSAALGVAAIGALARLTGRYLLPYQVARQAQALETEELGLECGVQDQLAAAYGGVNYIEVRYPDASVFPVPVDDGFLCEMESNTLLVYTGKSHFSSGTHRMVIEAYTRKDKGVMEAFDALARTPELGLEALLRKDWKALADAANMNWENQKRLHPCITTDEIEDLGKLAFREGAVGFKLNGAGAGGTATILCGHDRMHAVERAIREKFPSMRILNSKLDTGRCQGLQVWEI